MAARLLDFPDPVGPVIRTRPLDILAKSVTIPGRPRSSGVLIWLLIFLRTRPRPDLCINRLPLNLNTPISTEKSTSPLVLSLSKISLRPTPSINSTISLWDIILSVFTIFPACLKARFFPSLICISE